MAERTKLMATEPPHLSELPVARCRARSGVGLLSRLQEFQSFVDELIVILEDAAVPGIGIEFELGIG